ncbi:PilN domain-containing protein [Schnuerera sp. xch1]|uniref:PilN domain-containing protein n=1 Tax=Schnuerera sp. xch1 TaxID=2874283 RepID=UPI001CBBAEE6|nr:PilN domain-containing protein [Schnuerera sp. xch1]MBZ2173732.1 PilN domain-containing protein [Schnuerera sp. xch1]
MKDLNFFASYIDKKRFNIDKQMIYYSTVILLISLVLIYSLFNQIRIRIISKDIVKLKAIISNERINKKVDKIIEDEAELNLYKNSLNEIRLLDEYVESNSTIEYYLFDMIISNTPNNIFFTSISMYTDNIQIIGNSIDQLSIGQLVKNFESIETFKNVFVSSISKEKQYYTFILNIDLKGVNMDGEVENIDKLET